MSAAWLAYVLITGVLVVFAAHAVASACALARIPQRWTWLGGMLFALLLAALAPQREGPETAVHDTPATVSTSEALLPAAPAASASPLRAVREGVAVSVAGSVNTMQRLLPAELVQWHPLVWLAMSGATILLLAIVHTRVSRARLRWPALLLHGTLVRVSPASGPAVLGVRRAEIVVPERLLTRSADEQRMVVCHEREHLVAGDHVLLATAWICTALMPWNPALWWMLSRLRLAIELDCDARVLRSGASKRAYGSLLIDLTAECSGLTATGAAFVNRGSHLKRRLMAMYAHKSPFQLLRGGALTVVAALFVASACETRMPTAAEVDAVDASAMERVADQLGMVNSSAPVIYYVDGKQVSQEEALKLSGREIAQILVRRAAPGQPNNEILIITAASVDRQPGAAAPRSSVAVTDSNILVRLREVDAFAGNPMVIVDGVIQLQSEDGRTIDPLKLSRVDIESVEVVRGQAAVQLYGERAKSGVINIRTKKK